MFWPCPESPPALREVLRALARRTAGLLDRSRPFAAQIRDRRLSLEVALIQTLAEDLTARLLVRDPLSDRVHHRKLEMPGLLLRATVHFAAARLRPKKGSHRIPRPVHDARTPDNMPSVATAQQKGSNSSFYSAMRLMPKAERDCDVRDLWLLPHRRRHRR